MVPLRPINPTALVWLLRRLPAHPFNVCARRSALIAHPTPMSASVSPAHFALPAGDVLVVAEWDRATRSMMDGVHIIERIHARGAMIKVLDKPHLDLTTPIGRGFIAFLSALAEDERQRIVKRADDGRAAARKRGVHMGRKPKLTELQRRVACERVAK